MELETGLYEQIINKLFERKLNSADRQYYIGTQPITRENVVRYLSQYLYMLIKQVLIQLPDSTDSVAEGMKLANGIIRKLVDEYHLNSDNLIEQQKEILTAVIDKTNYEYPDIAAHLESIMPLTTLTKSNLFTGSGINMHSELQKEIMTSDEICLLVSFIKQSGLNLIYKQLEQMTKSGKRLRVITTTYTKATDFEAVKRLAMLENTEVKISYNSSMDRLHAKSYIFLRQTGFHTAYIGSSNISAPALKSGLEWNLKITQTELPEVMHKICNTFEAYWLDEHFETFVSGRDDEKLSNALSKEYEAPLNYALLDLIRAHDYQERILEQLRIERELHHRYRNLVVAATGTGKTVIAAFDFKRYLEEHPKARLLFVAHREEILKQSIQTFRAILGDYNFGDLWTGNKQASSYEHLFASKDILNNRLDSLQLPEDYYDFIIIDEVHHVVANTYRKILERFSPHILLGLTATPERLSGEDITLDFDNCIAAEIRLATALNQKLLSPFYYYGISDCVNLNHVKWNRGRYDIGEISHLYTGNDSRVLLIVEALAKYVEDYRNAKALCFCVDKNHADYMAEKFTMLGLKAGKLTSDNNKERVRMSNALKEGTINYLFVVDMFNEGVDIPQINTILFLRPTESLTIFIQQLGRGLRKFPGKTHVDILDFVGECNQDFNFSDRFRAMTGPTSSSLVDNVKENFPQMPLGCHIVLEAKAKEYILNNIQRAVNSYSLRIIGKLINNWSQDSTQPLTLTNFIGRYNIPLEKLYNKHTFTQLRRQTDSTIEEMKHEENLWRAVYRKWSAMDSSSYFQFLERLCQQEFCLEVQKLPQKEQSMLLMLYYDLFQEARDSYSLQQMVDELHNDKPFVNEMLQVVQLLQKRCNVLEKDDNSQLLDFPLQLHGIYTRDQIRVAIGTSTIGRKSPSREGVERNKERRIEAMFVDIVKDRKLGDSTNYDDHAMSNDIFVWDTQNSTTPDTTIGKNYIQSFNTMLLFVRPQNTFPDDKTRTMGYVYLGKATYLSHTYKKVAYGMQMQIKWHMEAALPASVYEYAKLKIAL